MPGHARSLPELGRRPVRCGGYPRTGPFDYGSGDDAGARADGEPGGVVAPGPGAWSWADGPIEPDAFRPSAMDRIRRSGPGAMLAAAMLGLAEVIEGRPPREEIAIVTEAPGEPFRRVELRLDPVHKERSLVIVHAEAPPAPSPHPDADRR
ncbi:MAG: hypothetical protein KJ056_13000 [Acidimicrobiia bacterium]|nr:hypothetical protein [Acidimicrobiia bacterium]MCL4293920.1 hypothetical protein [Acidimicrobiia bacterium]